MMRALFITAAIREEADRIIEYAFANPYYVTDSIAPGLIPQHILMWPVGGYRAVFSLTVFRGIRYRHLSVSQEEHCVIVAEVLP